MTYTKRDARQRQIATLRVMPLAQRIAETKTLWQQLTTLPVWRSARTIATTISGDFEVDTSGVIAAAQQAGKSVLVPRTLPHRQLAFLPFTTMNALVRSKFGILEPPYDPALVNNQPDLMIVPGLAYTQQSRSRLGFGGGYYDRFLTHFVGTTVALALSVQIRPEDDWPRDTFDVPLQHIITTKH
ncbi:5-formyltetrahydrofolate cyclo-ligase [Lacticaseibacillus thailandensis]|uniref:5-formyltetrahydrofolate cyclo-ligase n=1 Tax=Lacticaseibacillus thailandensis DSM 22698 = JCM 13996 TaxID=1423810 RepID=A0A0R2C9F0_9LACO|nr:5-formyltetrahydrofolate cyclo-ligase [Lacticaseibacillus thailandensis]KRM86628.1 5-formyltetrahydrofolate cyclo-ligase [Lacticaseibacillus thailandensis DSM 22698 = JCM 13996]